MLLLVFFLICGMRIFSNQHVVVLLLLFYTTKNKMV
jgi:hypothetical protein